MNFDKDERARIAGLVKELRGGDSLRTFSRKMGVGYTAISAWEKMEQEPSLDGLEAIAIAKGWSLPYLYYYVRGLSPSSEDLAHLASLLPLSEQLSFARHLLGVLALADDSRKIG